jgi:SpoVK/Ycf46/Vps4 family AAA+-type ATPase
MENVWVKSANAYALREVSTQTKALPTGVYKFQVDQFGNPFLTHVQDRFYFPYKVYGVEEDFINRVVRSYSNTTGNFGIILNGLKGTGKTVTAEIIANKLELPVIIITEHNPVVVSFLNDIQQDVIVFIDEYEKIYDGYDNKLLTVMDGALKTKSRLFFLLTTNELRVERNLLMRPSRVRYIKTFTDLTLPVIMEVVKDKLIHQHLFDATVQFISELSIITMDIVKSVVEEVNIHEEDPQLFKDVFNINGDQDNVFNVYTLEDGEKVEVSKLANVYPEYITPNSVNQDFYINRKQIGTIESVVSESQIVVNKYDYNDEGEVVKSEKKVYIIEKGKKIHSAFSSVFAY